MSVVVLSSRLRAVPSARLRAAFRPCLPSSLRSSVQVGPRPFGSVGRLALLEVRRSAVVWLLPLLAVVFWLDTYRSAMASFPVWDVRGQLMAHHIVDDFALFSAGVAAWTGSRDGRRGAADLTTTTPRPAWCRRGVALAATTGWMLAAYAACVAVVFGVTASQHAWGSPPWWLGAVGAVGVLWPSRFAAPLTAAAVGVALIVGASASGTSIYLILVPGTGNLDTDIGTYYRYLPDQAIVQTMLLAGLAVVAAGLIGVVRAGGTRRLRATAAIVTATGLAAAGTAVALAGTAQLAPDRVGYVIPAFGEAAADGMVPYTPVCQASPVGVCVNPAFRAQLPQLDGELVPFFAELAGLPGAPVRVREISSVAGMYLNWGGQISGTPPTYQFALSALGSLAGTGETAIITFIGGNSASGGTPAQQAVELALLRAAGSDEGASWLEPAAVTAAAGRFAALPAARHAWLVTHLAALRAGHVSLEQL
jgi:hypothetical protein